jgi:hypothetical protein
MPTTYRAYMPEQGLLLPESLSDWLPEDRLAHFVSDAPIVGSLFRAEIG